MKKPLEEEFDYYVKHQDELVKKYLNKFIVIKGRQVIGIYDSELAAIEETKKSYALGTFMVKKCLPGKESYTLTFHSRVAF